MVKWGKTLPVAGYRLEKHRCSKQAAQSVTSIEMTMVSAGVPCEAVSK